MTSGLFPPVIVTGFGRCGSSLVMQMLQAGGFPVTGEYPSFECEAYNTGGAPPPPGASKILDLHRNPPPAGPYLWIWLDRDRTEQAKSQAKFLRLLCGIRLSRTEVRAMAGSYQADRKVCFAIMQQLGGPVLLLTFEKLIEDSFGTAARIAAFVAGTDQALMAATVRKRSPACLPYLLEAELVGGAGT